MTESHELAGKALLEWWAVAGVDLDDARAIMRAPIPAPRPTAGGASPQARPAPPTAKAAGPIDPALKAAADMARAAGTIGELRRAVEAFEGCGLKAAARNTVFGDGVENSPVLLIGEGPGKEEDEQGKPFVGRSGQLLDRMLASVGLSRQANVFISNVVYWRPPGNRPATQGELAACLPFVDRLIALTAPKMLILAGGVAAQTVLRRQEGVTKLRGRRLVVESKELTSPINALVMLHPAYLLRQPQQKRLAWADLLALAAWLEELGVATGQRI